MHAHAHADTLYLKIADAMARQIRTGETEDHKEALLAQREKRAGVFKGH